MAHVFFTSDMHTYLYDTSYIQGDSFCGGYFDLAKHFNKEALIIDGGDVLQGSPLARQVYKQGFTEIIQAQVMNAAGVQVFVPGNHDFNFGYEVFRRFTDELDAQLVCANLVDESNRIDCTPYILHTAKDGTKLAVIGIVTDYVNIWEDAQTLGPLRITDALQAARRTFDETKSFHPDYTICVYHGGYNDSYSSRLYHENRATELSTIGFDYLLTCHQHAVVHPYRLGTAITLQCGSRAMYYARLALTKTHSEAEVLSVQEGPVYENKALDEAMQRLLPLHRKVQQFLATDLGVTACVFSDIEKLDSALHGSTLADFFNQVQLNYTQADISCVSLFNECRSLGTDVTAGNIIAVYPFPNTLMVVLVDGSVLKQALERCASYFDIIKGEAVISDRFLKPKVEHYNYDYYQNLDYAFDLAKPLGERVVKLFYHDHNLLEESDVSLHLVMNNYRATGTGGYECFAGCTVLRTYKKEMQELLFETFEQTTLVKTPSASTFQVLIDGRRI